MITRDSVTLACEGILSGPVARPPSPGREALICLFSMIYRGIIPFYPFDLIRVNGLLVFSVT